MSTFESLGLSASILEAVSRKGFEEPSPIQAATIPALLEGSQDIIAQAQTGTGKTAAFGLPLLDLVSPEKKNVQALVLTPTRELAIQVCEEINSFKGNIPLRVVPVYGGQAIDQQLRQLKRGVHIVVGTPGRVIDHINRKSLDLSSLDFLVLDEADEMLNMGFIDDMEKIMENSDPDKRTLMFSATMPEPILKLASGYMHDYQSISVKKKELTTSLTEQIYFEVRVNDKFEALCRIIDIEDEFYGLVFCKTKNDVDKVSSHLVERGYDADAIHGDISQNQREKTLEKFRKQITTILVATDVAARGIDVQNLTHVINYSLPQDPESYVHRIGRTGRAGKQGTAVTFITPSEYKKLMHIQRIAKSDIKKSSVPRVKEIIELKQQRIHEDLAEMGNEGLDATYVDWARSLLEENSPEDVVARLLAYSFADELDPTSYNEIREIKTKKQNYEPEGKTRLFISRGKKDDITPKKLVHFIIDKTGVRNSHIDEVNVYDNFSFITVPFQEAERILKIFRNKSGKGKPLVTRAKTNKPEKKKKK